MRWAAYRSPLDDERHVGLLDGDRLLGLRPGVSLQDVLEDPGLAAAAAAVAAEPFEIVPVAGTRLLAPIDRPPSIRDFMSFEDHVVTATAAVGGVVDPVWYEQPTFYFSNPAAVYSPSEDVPVAPGSACWDYELEIAAVIGLPGGDIAVADAESHIAGYTVLCDWSARDLQQRESRVGLGPAKGKDTATTLGPWLVTPDELEQHRSRTGYDLAMTAHVNGRPYSSGSWSALHWTFAQMVTYASRGTELRPGDVIGSGTVGSGCILELSRVHGPDRFPWLVPGDVVRLAVEQLGEIEVRIVPGVPVAAL